jgi:hypothetical protein
VLVNDAAPDGFTVLVESEVGYNWAKRVEPKDGNPGNPDGVAGFGDWKERRKANRD